MTKVGQNLTDNYELHYISGILLLLSKTYLLYIILMDLNIDC